MNIKKHRFPAIIAVILAYPILLSATPADSSDNASCFRCHGLSTLGVRDTVLGGIRRLNVAPGPFGHSIHGDMKCVQCHTAGYSRWPHAAGREGIGTLTCTQCHQDPKRDLKALFSDIQIEYQSSVHERRMGEHFSCFSCHDPHTFQREKHVTRRKIESANGMCLNCHDSETRFTSLTKRDFPVLEMTHAWLPNQRLHWQSVRCVDCHSSYDAPNMSHNILPKEQAVTKCESCHSQNSVLLAKLYKHQHKETRQKMGFVNGTLLNDAYIIGSTRNAFLDRLSIVLFGLLFVGVGGHGFLRFALKRKRKPPAPVSGEMPAGYDESAPGEETAS